MNPHQLEMEEEVLGRWPRRLLHVPSMTSMPWTPGNRYGPFSEPAYNVITYTWGRWRLHDGETPEVPALGVRGVPWKIPRVRPSAFTAAQLHKVVQHATRPHRQMENPIMRSDETEPVNFIWLDVACIDQRGDEPGSAAEIGRQALIFEHARQVFVWLSTKPTSNLRPLLAEFESLHKVVNSVLSPRAIPLPDYMVVLKSIHKCFVALLSDPWFTSLWTLQEAFLRPDAVLLSSEAEAIVIEDLGDYHFTLFNVLMCNDEYFRENMGPRSLPDIYFETRKLLSEAGLPSLSSLNALGAYIAAHSRKVGSDRDRIYGIQQIFRFRLGISSPTSPPGVNYSRAELDIQFGSKLLETYPIFSQMHFFTVPAPVGQGWLVNPSSITPPELHGNITPNHAGLIPHYDNLCRLSTAQLEEGNWGYFEGKTCPFSWLYEQCQGLERARPNLFRDSTLLIVHPDATEELGASPEQHEQKGQELSVRRPRQEQLCSWLAHQFPRRDNLVVLLLGSISHSDSDDSVDYEFNAVIALLLLPCQASNGFHYYRRVGFCWWNPGPHENNYEIKYTLPGMSQFLEQETWKRQSGYFG
ncbi:hypothetical protein PG993_003126 [Apiospora rasikravindrae]|uniref:Heterokaryon incompatibility domain-containing protein n=1 Tax=Apiospora rasikravindrae TaxID=990691 RepID=A0ABR1U0S8_9PEZI